jgi:hypothetical protein
LTVDPTHLPTVLWHVSLDRIRKGLGVQRLEPVPASWLFAGGHASFKMTQRKTRYWAHDCYTTEEEARAVGLAIIAKERERGKSNRRQQISKHLPAAEAALRGKK